MRPAKFCLSLDIDWAADEVIADALALVAGYGIRATWFVTHPTPQLREIAATPGQELGLHPNFNPLFDGSGSGTAQDVVLRLRDCAPEAVSVRSHSLTRSSRFAGLFQDLGLTHESNYLIPPSLGRSIGPWRDWSGMVEVPIRWEDDVRLIDPAFGEPADLVGALDLLVVDVHPIHLFLNTAMIADYEASRGDARDVSALRARRRPPGSGGSRDRLLATLDAVRSTGAMDLRIRDCCPSDEA